MPLIILRVISAVGTAATAASIEAFTAGATAAFTLYQTRNSKKSDK